MNAWEILLHAAGLIRDFAALFFAGLAALSVLTELIRLARGKRSQVPSNHVTGAMMGFVFGALGCFAPLENGILLGRVETIFLLALGMLLWGVVFAISRRRV